jgi:hypothetical protein
MKQERKAYFTSTHWQNNRECIGLFVHIMVNMANLLMVFYKIFKLLAFPVSFVSKSFKTIGFCGYKPIK